MRALLRLLGLAEGDPDGDGVGGSFTAPDAATVIGPSVAIKGELQGQGAMTVLGRFEGDIVLEGELHVGPDARVEANISAHRIVVAGTVRGNLSADTRVEILPNGSLTGTVKSGSFAAAAGATVKGEIWVERPAPPPGVRPA